MAEAKRDQNHVTTALFESSSTPGLTLNGRIDEITGRILVTSSGGGGGSPGGSNTDIQFNDSGSFGGEDTFTFDKSTQTVTLGTEGGTGTLRAPDAVTASTPGGSLSLIAGTGTGPGVGGVGGNVFLFSGDSQEGSFGASIFIEGADNSNEAGHIQANAGNAGTGTNHKGGHFSFIAGDGDGTEVGGSFYVNAGSGGDTGNGGDINFSAGFGGDTSGNGGSILLQPGGVTSGTPGTINLKDSSLAGASNGDVWKLADQTTGAGEWGAGGSGSPGSPDTSIQFNDTGSFAGSSTLLFNGTDTITFGTENGFGQIIGTNATVSGHTGAEIDIIGGNGLDAGNGGLASLVGGAGGDTGAGGGVTVIAGDGGATSGDGGNITIQPGDAPIGSAGRILVGPTGDDAYIVSRAFGGILTSLDESAGWTIYGTDGVSADVGGGTVSLVGGNASASGNSVGGPVQLTAGTGQGTGAGGDITLAAGVAGQTASIGGSIVMRSGYATGGAPAGVIKMANTATGPYGILDFTSIASTDKTFTFPNTSGTLALVGGTTALTVGTTTIASGTDTRILYDNSGVLGEYTLTGTGTVVVMATSPTFTTGLTTPQVLATANDSGALGASGTAFSDLFLASGGVINWAAANVTLTQSSGILTQDHGELRITSANVGTNADSVPTLSSTSTLTNKTLTSPTIQTSPVLAAATNLKFTVPTADPSATGITTNEFNSGYSSTAIGDLVYLDSSATWQKADADASAATYSSMLGIALSVAASGAAVNVLLQGFFYGATALPTLTIGAPVYMSATAGAMTQTAPVTTDSATRVLGYGIHADKMYFNPSNDWITHT